MKIIKFIFSFILILLLPVCFIQVSAEKGYLEAKDYITSSSEATDEITSFLQVCKNQNKDAFFNKGIYKINGTIVLQNGVSLIGESGTIFQGIDVGNQSYLKDSSENVISITIENIIFDNVTIYFQKSGSDQITIQNNVFLNAKFADTSIGGLEPDASNKNGGKSTGYYISKSHNQITILSNMFLRDKNSLGRGVAIYKTKNALIQDNYFGILEDVEKSIVSEQTKALKRRVLDSGVVDTSSNQGYFMTAINVLNSDENVKVIGNHISVNKDITEAGYEDGSQSTNGYNRDHLLYAKMYNGLDIVGNYFKGMNKNQDGGLKCRNGENLLIYKNIFEDSLILLYVQNANSNLWLRNVLIKENFFINKDYTNELIEIQSGSDFLKKYITIDYLILLQNYVNTAEINNITMESNQFYSAGLPNEQIRIENAGYPMPTNLTIKDNTNICGNLARLTIRNTQGSPNYDSNQQGSSPSFANGVTYSSEISERYQMISVEEMVQRNEIGYEIQNNILVSSADKIYVNGIEYQNEPLQVGQVYKFFLLQSDTTEIQIETQGKIIPTYQYTIASITLDQTYPITYQLQGHGQPVEGVDLDHIPNPLPIVEATGYTFDGWYLDLEYKQRAIPGDKIYQATTLYAKWIPNRYSITYNSEYGVVPGKINDAFSLPETLPVLTATGYTFGGWYLDKTYTTKAVAGQPITADTTLYAKWTEMVIIHFKTDQQITTTYVEPGSKIPIPQNPTKEGYIFDGWYLDKTYSTAWDFNQTVDHPISLYAKWSIQMFTITYHTQNHGGTIEEVKVISSLPNPLPVLSETGWEFQGWYLDETYTSKAIAGQIISADTTLYAKWLEVPKFVVTFHIVQQGVLAQVNVTKGKQITQPAPPIKEGYTFDGWYKDQTCQVLWDFNSGVEENMTLYAKWISIEENKPSESSPNSLWIILPVIGVGIISIGIICFIVYKKKKK